MTDIINVHILWLVAKNINPSKHGVNTKHHHIILRQSLHLYLYVQNALIFETVLKHKKQLLLYIYVSLMYLFI